MAEKGTLIVLSGPSGAGKGTIVKKLLERGDIALSISYTTRAPRGSEQHGKDYYFVETGAFLDKVAGGEFLEHANVFGCYYGTPRKEVLKMLDSGKNVILEIDVQGAMQVKQNYPQAVMVFIMPPSKEELLRRLRGRGTETEEQIARRIGKAQAEMDMVGSYEHTVINDDLERAVSQVEEIISRAKTE